MTANDPSGSDRASVLATDEYVARGPWLDPEVAALATTAPVRNLLEAGQLAALRSVNAQLPAYQMSPDVVAEDHPVSAHAFVRVYRSRERAGPRPAVYSMHGGGMVVGSVSMDDARFDRWCPTHGVVGVSVEYRLPPESPYPGPLDDCLAGWTFVHEHAGDLGIDTGRVGMTGGSAGGGLAAGLTFRLRDEGGPMPRFLLLEVPMLDDRQVTPSSRLDGLLVWTRESNEFGWRAYLGELYGTSDVPYWAAPARCADLRGFPPTYVSAGGADGFRDEDIEFAMRLGQAGVPTELHVHPGAPHGVAMFAGVSVATRFQQHAEDWLVRQLRALDV